MKKFYILTFALLPLFVSAQDCSGLFFSEYIEGSGYSKALEIFNPTIDTINLSGYSIQKFTNGSDTSTVTHNMFGKIAPGDVYVVAISDSRRDTAIKAVEDTTSTAANFNGNDAIVLLNGTDTLDIIGVVGEDPGTAWAVGSGSTAEYTLVRDSSVKQGTTDWSVSQNQWVVYPQDDFTHLGSHFMENDFADFTTSPVATCEGDTAQLFDSSPGATAWMWVLEGAEPDTSYAENPKTVWQNGGTYNVTLYATNACGVDSVTKSYTIYNRPISAFTAPDTVGLNQSVSFANSSSGATQYSWNFGDNSSGSSETNPTHTYTAEGTYTVQLAALTNYCSDTATQTIVVIKGVGIKESPLQKAELTYFTAGKQLHIELNLPDRQNVVLSLHNLLGQEIFKKRDYVSTGSYDFKLNVPPGIYFLSLQGERYSETKKIILK